MTKTAVVHLTLAVIAGRISEHLHRFEHDPKINRYPKGHSAALSDGSGRPYWDAAACVGGSRIGIAYYRGHGWQYLRRDEALAYLGGLDKGFVGPHHRYFEKHPVHQHAKPIRYYMLTRSRFCGYELFAVTKTTTTRIYGYQVYSNGNQDDRETFIDRDRIVKRQATPADLAAVQEAERVRDAAHDRVDKEFRAALAVICGKQPNHGADDDVL